ncbi:MAG: IS66 family transposase, partial [Chloroflexales bacterium]|nr:IS66 family transposase [Chloroflexales bacterium]
MDEPEPPPFDIACADWAATPASVRAVLLALRVQRSELTPRVRDLEAQLKQTSQNSSKPPSADPPSAPPPRPATTPRGRPRGGQVGHAGHQRPLAPPAQVDTIVPLHPTPCGVCQAALDARLPDVAPVARAQVWELPPIRPHIPEYQHHTVCCPTCQTHVVADRPADAPPGSFGSRATELIALLHGRYRLSERETAALRDEGWGLSISLGSIARSCERVSDALLPVDRAIHACVQAQDVANVDETSWTEAGQRCWLWAATTPVATCFRIARSRGRPSLWALIGETFSGIVGSDRMKAYNGLSDSQRQRCWAHLTRNLRALAAYGHPDSPWAARVLVAVAALFAAWHAFGDAETDRAGVQAARIPVQTALRALLEA